MQKNRSFEFKWCLGWLFALGVVILGCGSAQKSNSDIHSKIVATEAVLTADIIVEHAESGKVYTAGSEVSFDANSSVPLEDWGHLGNLRNSKAKIVNEMSFELEKQPNNIETEPELEIERLDMESQMEGFSINSSVVLKVRSQEHNKVFLSDGFQFGYIHSVLAELDTNADLDILSTSKPVESLIIEVGPRLNGRLHGFISRMGHILPPVRLGRLEMSITNAVIRRSVVPKLVIDF